MREGATLRDIAGKYGVSKSSLDRHRAAGHEKRTLAAALPPGEEPPPDKAKALASASQDSLHELLDLKRRLFKLLSEAEATQDRAAVVLICREIRTTAELIFRLLPLPKMPEPEPVGQVTDLPPQLETLWHQIMTDKPGPSKPADQPETLPAPEAQEPESAPLPRFRCVHTTILGARRWEVGQVYDEKLRAEDVPAPLAGNMDWERIPEGDQA